MPSSIISHRMGLSEAAEAYRMFAEREATKIVLTPRAEMTTVEVKHYSMRIGGVDVIPMIACRSSTPAPETSSPLSRAATRPISMPLSPRPGQLRRRRVAVENPAGAGGDHAPDRRRSQ